MKSPKLPATDRLRRFSRAQWVLGVGLVCLMGVLFMPDIGYDPGSGRIVVMERGRDLGYELDRPWFDEEPVRLEIVDGVIEGGPEGGYIALEPGSKPLRLTAQMIENVTPQYGRSWLMVHQGVRDFFRAGEVFERTEHIRLVGSLEAEVEPAQYVVPMDEPTQVWFSGDTGNWRIAAEEVDAVPLEGSVQGSGNAVLEYRGEGLSAKFEHTGTGIFSARAIVPGQRLKDPITGIDDFTARLSWDPVAAVLFVIESDTGDGEWAVTVSE